MPQHKKNSLLALPLIVLPILAVVGCGGGNSSIVPTPTPTVTASPTPTGLPLPTATPTPTTEPTDPRDQFYINLKISNSAGQLIDNFQTGGGAGAFKSGGSPVQSSFDITFYENSTNVRRVQLKANKAGTFHAGDSISLTDNANGGTTGGRLIYTNITKEESFTSKSGTFNITRVRAIGTATEVVGTLSDVVMVPTTGIIGNKATGTFTITGTAETILTP